MSDRTVLLLLIILNGVCGCIVRVGCIVIPVDLDDFILVTRNMKDG